MARMEKTKPLAELLANAHGGPVIYNGKNITMMDTLKMKKEKERFRIKFEEKNAQWRQGFVLETNGSFHIKDFFSEPVPFKVIYWYDTAPSDFEIVVDSIDLEVKVYNVWDVGNGTVHYWHNGAAMYVEKFSWGKRYHCNDGYPDDDLNDLIFSIEYMDLLKVV